MPTKTAKTLLTELVARKSMLGATMNVNTSDIANENGQFTATCTFRKTSEGPTVKGLQYRHRFIAPRIITSSSIIKTLALEKVEIRMNNIFA